MEKRKWFMGTNTKAYKTVSDTKRFIQELERRTKDISREDFELFVIPSFTSLYTVGRDMDHSLIRLGAQNMVWESGQYTGEISPEMLKECECDQVMIGHSERRHTFFEDEEMIRNRVESALIHKFDTLLCVGETEEEKAGDKNESAVRRQLFSALQNISASHAQRLRIAYEPVWAIGTGGKEIRIDYADRMLTSIRKDLIRLFGEEGKSVPVFYGGSVNPDNAPLLARCSDIDGLFIGRSAWDAVAFEELIRRVLKEREAKPRKDCGSIA